MGCGASHIEPTAPPELPELVPSPHKLKLFRLGLLDGGVYALTDGARRAVHARVLEDNLSASSILLPVALESKRAPLRPLTGRGGGSTSDYCWRVRAHGHADGHMSLEYVDGTEGALAAPTQEATGAEEERRGEVPVSTSWSLGADAHEGRLYLVSPEACAAGRARGMITVDLQSGRIVEPGSEGGGPNMLLQATPPTIDVTFLWQPCTTAVGRRVDDFNLCLVPTSVQQSPPTASSRAVTPAADHGDDGAEPDGGARHSPKEEVAEATGKKGTEMPSGPASPVVPPGDFEHDERAMSWRRSSARDGAADSLRAAPAMPLIDAVAFHGNEANAAYSLCLRAYADPESNGETSTVRLSQVPHAAFRDPRQYSASSGGDAGAADAPALGLVSIDGGLDVDAVDASTGGSGGAAVASALHMATVYLPISAPGAEVVAAAAAGASGANSADAARDGGRLELRPRPGLTLAAAMAFLSSTVDAPLPAAPARAGMLPALAIEMAALLGSERFLLLVSVGGRRHLVAASTESTATEDHHAGLVPISDLAGSTLQHARRFLWRLQPASGRRAGTSLEGERADGSPAWVKVCSDLSSRRFIASDAHPTTTAAAAAARNDAKAEAGGDAAVSNSALVAWDLEAEPVLLPASLAAAAQIPSEGGGKLAVALAPKQRLVLGGQAGNSAAAATVVVVPHPHEPKHVLLRAEGPDDDDGAGGGWLRWTRVRRGATLDLLPAGSYPALLETPEEAEGLRWRVAMATARGAMGITLEPALLAGVALTVVQEPSDPDACQLTVCAACGTVDQAFTVLRD